MLELRYPSAAALLPLPVEQDPGRQPGAPSPAVPCACSRRANACWLFFSVKQISLAHYFCKIFKKEQPPTAESQPKCESQQILGRVKGALPARRPPASQIRLQGRNLPAVMSSGVIHGGIALPLCLLLLTFLCQGDALRTVASLNSVEVGAITPPQPAAALTPACASSAVFMQSSVNSF